MAHFARIENGIVREVIVINNDVMLDKKGKESEALGIAFCKSLYGDDTEWVQTSYNGNFRGQYAGIGMIYDPDADQFFEPIIEEQA